MAGHVNSFRFLLSSNVSIKGTSYRSGLERDSTNISNRPYRQCQHPKPNTDIQSCVGTEQIVI